MDPDTTPSPATAAEVRAKQTVTFIHPVYGAMLFRRQTPKSLLLSGAIPLRFIHALEEQQRTDQVEDDPDAIQRRAQTGEEVMRHVISRASIAPRIVMDEPDDPDLLAVRWLDQEDLEAIFEAITAPRDPDRLTGAAVATFPGGEPQPVAAAVPSGADVRPETEQLVSPAAVDLQHG